MALAFSITDQDIWGKYRAHYVTITFDSSYPDNGEAIVAADFGLKVLKRLLGSTAMASDGSTAVVIRHDATNSKILAFESGASGAVLPEKGDTESLANYTADVIAIGW